MEYKNTNPQDIFIGKIMISTVTTSTVSTVTTVAMAGSLALIGIVVLLILLMQKEVTTVSASSNRVRTFRQVLNIGIVPLLIAFIIVMITKVIQVLH
jgi:hypothetical protein